MAERKRVTAEQVVGYLLEGEGLDFLRESLARVVQQLMEAEVSELVGAERGERAPEERLTHRERLPDAGVGDARNRPLEGRYPYPWLDAKVEKVRDGGRVVRKCLVLAYGVHESGYREVIGLDVGEAETEAFWRSFLRSLVERGLVGVQLVVSDAHAGLKKAIAQVLGCPWQRCSVHFLREALGHARRERARAATQTAAEDRGLARGGRGGPARLLRVPGRPLAEAALHQPARTGHPRDRSPHRRRRHQRRSCCCENTPRH
jgi:transposase-like protein